MEQHTISNHQIASFAGKLQEDERSPATIENYLRHIRAFAAWAGEQAVTKELVASWKEHLTGKDYRPGTVNTIVPYDNRHILYNYVCTDSRRFNAFLISIYEVREIGAQFASDVTVSTGDKVLVLSTCLAGNSQRRYLVLAVCQAEIE